ncbi:MAG: dockerin type I repeat-containing protein, partial [Lachnospiraceae bacterium]|nr:dockerin type I repeat-containing protein [Lachnospiraceae bacterium]
NAGTATVTILCKGNYTGTVTKTFTIEKKSIQSVSISSIAGQTYTGSAITPAVTVKDGNLTLIKGTDYTITYSNNVEVGTGIVTITGAGNYTESLSTTFIISSIPSVITSPKLSVEEAKAYISKISAGTSAESIISSLNEKQFVAIYKGNTKITGATLAGTGMHACIMNGNQISRKYTLIITGDTNGDGKISITDMISVKAHILKKSTLNDVYAKAGDVNGDGKVSITDFIKVKAALLGKDKITGITAE